MYSSCLSTGPSIPVGTHLVFRSCSGAWKPPGAHIAAVSPESPPVCGGCGACPDLYTAREVGKQAGSGSPSTSARRGAEFYKPHHQPDPECKGDGGTCCVKSHTL